MNEHIVVTSFLAGPGGYLRNHPDPENDWYILLAIILVFSVLVTVVALH